MDGRTAAAVLGITQGATRDEIRRAFRARAKTAHPDAHGTDEAFVTLRAAADLLLAAAPAAPTADRTTNDPSSPAPVDAVPGMAAMAMASAAGPTGAVGRRARWEHRTTARPGAAIDLTDRPVGVRFGRVPPANPPASAVAFAQLLEAELARH